MNQSNQIYNIQQVSNITGLSKQVIRKWEERYQVIQPQRLDNGYRIYSANELNILLKMKSLIEMGQTAKQAVMYIKQQQIETSRLTLQTAEYQETTGNVNEFVHSLLQEGTLGNEAQLNRLLDQAYHLFGLQSFLDSIVIPFLKEVGNRWKDGRWGEYQEALSSLVVRDFLIKLRRNFPISEKAPLVLGACLPEERHEIPLHMILLQFMLQGWRTVMLGPSPAPTAIQSTVQLLNPKKVVLSAVTRLPFERNERLIEELDEFASKYPHIQFYLGGPGAFMYLKGTTLQHIKLTDQISAILHQ
ncbi:MAG: MerR family transcriptional regulator [Bacillus sp. (in: Bacteria)]|nr:MerR family transcriptional regulator [Bacillus sp. (in: firmicutes)]